MPGVRSYPNGYVGVENELGVQGEADPEIQALRDRFINHLGRWTWDQEREVLECALRVLGDPAWFFQRQLKQPGLCKYRRIFLEQTIQFILTGHRDVSIYTNTTMFDYQNDSKPLHLQTDLLPKGVECLSLWLRHHGGFDDLVQSLVVFFGPKAPLPGV